MSEPNLASLNSVPHFGSLSCFWLQVWLLDLTRGVTELFSSKPNPELLLEEPDERFHLQLWRSRSGQQPLLAARPWGAWYAFLD